MSRHISALIETFKSECFATQRANLTVGRLKSPHYAILEDIMGIKLYEVSPVYIDYLGAYASHLFQNKKPGQHNERKYIGIILQVNDMNYFAPLSSLKPKHEKMTNRLDIIKIGQYAVININNMFPVPEGLYTYVDISKVKNAQYRKLLMSEYRIIRKLQDKIKKNAAELYKQKTEKKISTALTNRCNDFLLLEKMCRQYKKKKY